GGGGLDPRLLAATQARLTEIYGPDNDLTPMSVPGWEELECRAFTLPVRGTNKRTNAFTISRELDQQFPAQVAPEYYTVTQQYVQPGEDPERGAPVLGLRVGMADGGLSAPGDESLGAGVKVAVLDTGIDAEAVSAIPVPRQVFDSQLDIDGLVDESPLASGITPVVPPVLAPAAGHGSFIAGLIHCVAPGTTVMSIR